MKHIQRLISFAALVAGIVCIILLLNFTAPNPTGRRYSSRTPLTTGQGSSNQIGLDGERILASDLHLPRNDDPNQRLCICNNAQYKDPTNCSACIVSAPFNAPYRRPDFVGTNFIAEAKNAQNLFYDSRDFTQIGDYVTAAKALKQPLWVFTRVDTVIDPAFKDIVESTGGQVIPYFTVPGYIDPVDNTAKIGLLISALLLGGLWIARSVRSGSFDAFPSKPSPDPLRQFQNSVDHAEKFVKDSKDKQRHRID